MRFARDQWIDASSDGHGGHEGSRTGGKATRYRVGGILIRRHEACPVADRGGGDRYGLVVELVVAANDDRIHRWRRP